MSLSIRPLKNHLPTSDAAYLVHSECSDTVEYGDLVDIMARGRTTLTKPDISGCLELFFEEIEKLVEDGKYVKTPLGAFYLCASGKLESPDQPFTPRTEGSDHDLRLHFRQARGLGQELVAKARTERAERYDRSSPSLMRAFAVREETELSGKPGGLVQVEGQRLDFDKKNPAAGLFVLNGKETRAAFYVTVKPGVVIAEVPPGLEPGPYTLALRASPNGRDLKEGRLERPFVLS